MASNSEAATPPEVIPSDLIVKSGLIDILTERCYINTDWATQYILPRQHHAVRDFKDVETGIYVCHFSYSPSTGKIYTVMRM